MYPEYLSGLLKLVEKSRPKRLDLALSGKPVYTPMDADEREDVLSKYHPDYSTGAKRAVRVGPNKGQELTTEVATILEAHSMIRPKLTDTLLTEPDYETDLLIIGGGGAGCWAAITASRKGMKSLIATKLRLGDANTMMSEGGMQAAVSRTNSPTRHYLDAMGGGHFDNDAELVRVLTEDAPEVVRELENLGVMWDKMADGSMQVLHGGGTSRRRMVSCRDYIGAIIMRTLMDEVRNHTDNISIREFEPAVELLLDDKGRCAGAILYSLDTEQFLTVKAKATILATGGFGRLHIRGFATTNHYGATGDGLVIAYRAGAELNIWTRCSITRPALSSPSRSRASSSPRRYAARAASRSTNTASCSYSRASRATWKAPPSSASAALTATTASTPGLAAPASGSNSPIIDQIQGEGYIRKQFPGMCRQFDRFGIDIVKEPMLIYPSLHYQNGGVAINSRCETNIPGLYVAGEASGGVHGRNRLMGNSVLDYNVFGRRAGQHATEYAKSVSLGKLSLEHVAAHEREMQNAGIETDMVSPLILPSYTPEDVKNHQLARLGNVPALHSMLRSRFAGGERRTRP